MLVKWGDGVFIPKIQIVANRRASLSTGVGVVEDILFCRSCREERAKRRHLCPMSSQAA